jgi:hypothetical protein
MTNPPIKEHVAKEGYTFLIPGGVPQKLLFQKEESKRRTGKKSSQRSMQEDSPGYLYTIAHDKHHDKSTFSATITWTKRSLINH